MPDAYPSSGLSARRPSFEPTDALRGELVCHLLNGLTVDRIARIFGLSLAELRYHFRPEIEHGLDRVMAVQAATVLEMSRQRVDRGVALRAAQAILEPRAPAWRGAGVDARIAAGDIDSLSLEDLDAAIAKLEAEKAAAERDTDERA